LAPVPAAPVTPLPNNGRPVASCQGEKYATSHPTNGVQDPCDGAAASSGELAASVSAYASPEPLNAAVSALCNLAADASIDEYCCA